MSNKRGRKCSILSCNNFQHTHKHLSFFRFPKDTERCRTWIENTKRFDLLDKANVHDERICQQHFEPIMFLNESQNRLQQYAIPTMYLPASDNNFKMNGKPINGNMFNNTGYSMGLVNAAAALLSQNNLTITPVYSSKPKPKPITSQLPDEPLNLSASSQNGTISLSDTSVLNISDSTSESPNNSMQFLSNKTPTNGKIATVPTNVHIHSTANINANANVNTNVNSNVNSNVNATTTNVCSFRRPRQVFTVEQENQLADYVRETSNYYSGLSSKEARIMAFVYGVCNHVEMPPGWHESHQASFDWCVGFIKRTKLPPTMITGISTKGSSKQSKSSAPIQLKSNPIAPQINGIKDNGQIINPTPIEID